MTLIIEGEGTRILYWIPLRNIVHERRPLYTCDLESKSEGLHRFRSLSVGLLKLSVRLDQDVTKILIPAGLRVSTIQLRAQRSYLEPECRR